MKKDLIAHVEPKSHVSELFRTLRTNVQFMNSSKGLRSLLVTSTLPGEGKTWVASNLAIAFAQADKKVILIDADMRKCCLHNLFKVSPCPGLSNYLSGVNEKNFETQDLANYIRITKVPNLFLLPSGNVPPNPSELLTTEQMVILLEELKKEFDLIIIDGTPSKLVTDAVILSRLVDSTIIVAGHNMPKKDDLAKVVRDIKNVGGNIAGVVYNKKPATSKRSNETYYYASASAKWDSRKKQEIEAQQLRQAQRNRTTEMLNRDRKPEEYLKNVIQEVKKEETNNNTTENKTIFELGQSPEEKATEMLNQFNDYLQKEKENRDKRNMQ